MAFERIRAFVGRSGSKDRYPGGADGQPDDYTPPQEVADPHRLEDETSQSLGEWVTDHWLVATSWALLGITGMVLIGIYFGRYFLSVLLNPWVQRGAAAVAILGVGYWTGMSSLRGRIAQQDELTLYDPDAQKAVHFLGEFRAVEGASHDVFVPYKGYRKLLHSPEPYRIGELSRALVQRHSRDADEEAKIRLHPGVTTVELTDRGRQVTQMTAGLDPDPFGRESNLEATLPDMAATGTVTELKDELESANREIDKLQDDKNQLQRQRDSAMQMAQQNFDEVRAFIEDDIEMAAMMLPNRSQQQETQSTDPAQQALENAREELQNGDGGF